MMSSASRNVFKVFLVALMVLAFTSLAHAQKDDDDETTPNTNATNDLGSLTTGLTQAQQSLSNQLNVIFGHLTQTIQKASTDQRNALINMDKARNADAMEGLSDYYSLAAIQGERAHSGILTDEERKLLDEVNYEVLEGRKVVVGVGKYGQDNPAALTDYLSYIGKVYALHVRLFCDPAEKNAPQGCGADRALAGIAGDENFVDFFLSERSWQKEAVMDTMQVARAYFFPIKPRFSGNQAQNTPVSMIKWQRDAAMQSTRIAMLNMLAARRAPTSSATGDVLKIMLQNMAMTSDISTTDFTDMCAKDDKTKTKLEAYVCNYTNLPDPAKGGAAQAPRQLGQAAIDRIMQYDYYMSPMFYSTVQTSPPVGGLDRTEVLILAQQLTQDYYFLRMLQMKTVATALNSSVSLQ